jgi:signal transduction histidine kinase
MLSFLARLLRVGRARLCGVRVRSALAAAAVVFGAVTVAGLGLILSAQANLAGNVDAAARQRSGEVVAALHAADPGVLDETLQPVAGDTALVQVVDPAGRVLAGTPGMARRAAMSSLRPPPGHTASERRHLYPGPEDPFRIVATTVTTAAGDRTVLVAQSLRPVGEAVEVLARWAMVAVPLLAAVVGAATFLFVGRSLRPVEDIRRRVATITGRDLHARVPVPGTQDEVAALAATMNGMLDRLQAAADTQRRFVADASHELRSPLAGLQLGLEVLTPKTITAEHLAGLHAEARRVARLVDDLLLLARADENGLHPHLDDVDLDDLGYRHAQRLRLQHPHLTVVLQLRPARVRADVHQLDRVITNLCDNAARHAYATVVLTTHTTGTTAGVVVDDDGPGVRPADRGRIFDRFVRLDDSRTRHDGGTGLGLSICREIVHGHGGTLDVGESPAGGARFEVRLPLPADAEVPAASKTASPVGAGVA